MHSSLPSNSGVTVWLSAKVIFDESEKKALGKDCDSRQRSVFRYIIMPMHFEKSKMIHNLESIKYIVRA
jgi:5-keto 4-deoxyuronate isomerase